MVYAGGDRMTKIISKSLWQVHYYFYSTAPINDPNISSVKKTISKITYLVSASSAHEVLSITEKIAEFIHVTGINKEVYPMENTR